MPWRPRAAAAILLLLLLSGRGPAQEGTAPPGPAPDQARAATTPAAGLPGEAANLPYATEIAPTGDADLDASLAAASQLLGLQERAPTTPFGLVARAVDDRERLARALHAEGYWGGSLRIELGGIPLGAPELPERLEATRQRPVPVRIVADPGPRYAIGGVAVRPASPEGRAAVEAATRLPFGLAPGDPARAAPVLDAEQTLVDRLLDLGHPLANVARREAVVDYDRRAMDLGWTLAPGPFATFAPPVVEGERRVDGRFLTRYAGRLAGEPYSPERLERARKDLMALGAFDSVRAQVGDALDPAGRLPVTFTVSERPRRAIGATAAYETNYGPAFRVYWEHRNLWGGAERLRLEGEVARIGTGGGSLDEMTYRAFATLRDPGLLGRDLTLVSTIGALSERLEAYDRTAAVASVIFERRLSERLSLFAGPTADIGESGPPDGPLRPYQLLGVTFGGRYDATDSLLDPARGWRLNGAVTPFWSFGDEQPLAPLRATASTYWDVLGSRRSILAVRGTVGSLLGADRLDVPEHQRFYAGGGGSVRGYDYQSIGPRDPVRNRPSGGASLLEASLEWRQRVWGSWGAVAFVDAGTVGTGTAPDFSLVRVGVGLGVRYHTAIGPIRADVGLPLIRQQGSSGYGLYVGIGQAF